MNPTGSRGDRNEAYWRDYLTRGSSAKHYGRLEPAHVAERAVEAAQALLRATGHADPGGPWLPVGAGVNSGRVWFGAVGDGEPPSSPCSGTA